MRLRLTAALRPNLARRQLAGVLYRYGEEGMTSAGPLTVPYPDPIELPADITAVGLTRDHDREAIRGHLAIVDDSPERRYVVVQLDDGPAGDEALADAGIDPVTGTANGSRARAAFSFDVEDATVDAAGNITAGRLVYIGQVDDPAFNSARIDRIAAAAAPPQTATADTTTTGDKHMTPEQRARLAELLAAQNLTADEQTELSTLTQLAAVEAAAAVDTPPAAPAAADAADAPAPVAAARPRALPSVPAGVPGRGGSTDDRSGAYRRFCQTVTAALAPGGGGLQTIQAAFADVTSVTNPGTEAPAWSGELWSGLQFEPEWTPLFSSGDLTSWEGKGWRWTTKPSMQDYAGDKAAVPTNVLATEPGDYTAARMAVGHDIDRKFWDFPGGAAFLQSYGEAAREDWAFKLDAKVRAYALAQAVAYGAATTSLLKAAALALFGVKANTRAKGTFIAVNDTDFLSLLDVNEAAVPAFLDAFGIDVKSFVFDAAVPAKTVIAGVKQAATVRTLPGSPLRFDAQNLVNGGVDSAFFGYWAIEEHHTSGIVKTTWA